MRWARLRIGKHVKGMYPAPHIHEHLATAKLRTSTWTTLRTMARTPRSTRTCTMRSSEHAAHRLLMHSVLTSHFWLKVSLCVSFHVIHACARVCCSLSVSPSPVFLLPRPVPLPALPDVQLGAWRVLHRRSPVQLQLGEHGHSGLCHTPHRLWAQRDGAHRRWRGWTSLPPATSTSRTPWTTTLPSPTIPTSTTTSLRNFLQLWSIEQGNLLRWEAIMINFPVTSETWKVLRVSFL